MATSGTYSFGMDNDSVVTDAFMIAGGFPILGYEGRMARQCLNLLFREWQNIGPLLWTIPSDPIEQALTEGTNQYTLSENYIDIADAVIRRDDVDIAMQRLSMDEWLELPNKTTEGMPTMYYVNRQRDAIEVNLYFVPENSTDEFVYWPIKKIEDAGRAYNTPDAPARFLPALTHGLAYYLSHRRPMIGAERRAEIKALYDESLNYAMQEDHERSTLRIVPRIR